MLVDVRSALVAGLETAGFRPDSLRAKLVSCRIADRGDAELAALSAHIRPDASLRGVCSHHLGVGASLTEYLVAGLGLGRQPLAAVAALGGIAHLIFAVFDQLLDTAGHVPVLLEAAPVAASLATPTPKERLVSRLVELYFERLDKLAPTGNPFRSLLERAIHRLYDAELRTASTTTGMNRVVWWRKNVLPVVVMGIPAWLFPPDERNIRFIEHLQWLARVGDFFGWLDDICDYEQDALNGQINRLRLDTVASIATLAGRVTHKGRLVLELWDARNPDSPARDTFRILAWTWLNNPEP
jgi:hypothetical protein